MLERLGIRLPETFLLFWTQNYIISIEINLDGDARETIICELKKALRILARFWESLNGN